MDTPVSAAAVCRKCGSPVKDKGSYFRCTSCGLEWTTWPPSRPLMTPDDAGFDGSFLLFCDGSKTPRVRLGAILDTSEKRFTLPSGHMGVWKSEDGKCQRLVYRNQAGRLFELDFVPLEEPE